MELYNLHKMLFSLSLFHFVNICLKLKYLKMAFHMKIV